MARSESALNSEISSNGTGRLKSFDGIVDYWDGTITLDKLSENKGKWKKRYVELQASHDYIYLLIYKLTHRKKKHTHVPIRKFSLINETNPVHVGPNFKSKYTFDVGERVGKLFMRYRFGVETEDSRNRWIYEIITSFYINPNSQTSLKYLVTPMNTPVVMKLRMNEPSYLLLFKNHIELCRLSDLSRLGKWPVSSVHSYTTDKNIFTIKFKPNSMYGEFEILLYSDFTVEMFRILNSLITTGEFPPQRCPGLKRIFEIKKIPAIPPPPTLPGMMGQINSTPNSPLMSPIFMNRNWVKKTISNPDQNRILPVGNYNPSSPQFNTTPHPHSPERKGGVKVKQKRKSINLEETTNILDTYSTLNHFPNLSPVKERFVLNRTDNIMTYSELSQASHSTGNIPTLYAAKTQSKESDYDVANFHKIPGLDQTKFRSGLFIRSNSDLDISDKPPLPLKKTYSTCDLLSDDENPYDVIPDVTTEPQKLESKVFIPKKLPPPPPPPQPSDYISVTLPERGRGMRKSPSTDCHIGFGIFPLEENREWGRDVYPSYTSPQHNLLEDIKEH